MPILRSCRTSCGRRSRECRLGLARLHCRIGGSAAGAEHLAAAVALFRELGATFWAERAEAEVSEPG
jgi:hypothetical protein